MDTPPTIRPARQTPEALESRVTEARDALRAAYEAAGRAATAQKRAGKYLEAGCFAALAQDIQDLASGAIRAGLWDHPES